MTDTSPVSDPSKFKNQAAPGRDCGTCTLCCKVFDVPSLSKPAGKWCSHCTPGKGCGIHETRPDHCRAFFCFWMTEPWMGPEWKPEVSKFVITIDPISNYMLVQVDPGQPNAWRTEPYYSELRRFAAGLMQRNQLLIVFVGKKATALTPQGEVDLGILDGQDQIGMRLRMTPNGPVHDITRTRLPSGPKAGVA
jgi:Fe-S-cluster containining protein